MLDFTLQDFFELKKFIYEKVGISFKESKYYFLKRRVLNEIKKFNFRSFQEYFYYLKFRDHEETLLRSLISQITINETYFFREFEQLRIFAEKILPDYMKIKEKEKDRKIRILSAGCSNGSEPYTIAIIMNEMIDDLGDWDLSIEAFDIDEKALDIAKKGIYKSYFLRETAEYYINKYFVKVNDDQYRIIDSIKKYVRFFRLNLFETDELKRFYNVDFIFCRNVLIYFDDKARKKIVETFYLILRKGGYLFLGHSESVARITSAFNMKNVDGMIVYYK